MARGKGTETPRDDRERRDQAGESQQPRDATEQQSEQQPQNENPDWWRNEGGGQGEVY